MRKNMLAGLAALVAATAAPLAANAAQGLNASFYRYNANSVANAITNISSLTPLATFTANNVCFPNCAGSATGDGNTLATWINGNGSAPSANPTIGGHVLDLNGFLNIAIGGAYSFYLGSDDGSKLFIDGAEVVNNDGAHGTQFRFGQVTLTAGSHDLRIVQYENGGETSLSAGIFQGSNTTNNYTTYTTLGGAYLSTTESTGAVPEPATWAMMIMGFGTAGALLRRRRRAVLA